MAVTQFTSADLLPAMEQLVEPETFLERDVLRPNIVFHWSILPGRHQQGSALARAGMQALSNRQSRRARTDTRRQFYEVPELRATRETAVSDLDDRLVRRERLLEPNAERTARRASSRQDMIDLVSAATTRRVEKMTSRLALHMARSSYLLDDLSIETLDYGVDHANRLRRRHGIPLPAIRSRIYSRTSANTIIAN